MLFMLSSNADHLFTPIQTIIRCVRSLCVVLQRTVMSSDLLVDLHDELGGDDSPSAALDQLKLVPEKQWPQDDPVSVSKSATDIKSLTEGSHLAWDDPFYDIARHQIVEVAGDDNFGRKVIVFSACRMPPQHQLNHHMLLM
ncbi:hypothetical protein AMELA_G00014920 [Ameiurus melas]|uniref:Uncharacterized protein n=1 Tax=Ameiurus melas TaxID=219545 RepID=A0A7J6BH76_AMEME|nr:hypothetical protein AMELA_G00014920 [Ameiurus melas]